MMAGIKYVGQFRNLRYCLLFCKPEGLPYELLVSIINKQQI